MMENDNPKDVFSQDGVTRDLFYYVVVNFYFINAYYNLKLLALGNGNGRNKYCYFQPSAREDCCYVVIDNESERDFSPYINKFDYDCHDNIEVYCENITTVIAHMCEIAMRKK